MGEWEKVRERRREREREGAQWLMLRVLFPARNSVDVWKFAYAGGGLTPGL